MIDYFLSSHTSQGYYSFLEGNIKNLKHIFILKGGSIQIRSQVIRNIGIKLADRGNDVELLHGVDNPDILEGIIIPDLELALVDGENHYDGEPYISEMKGLLLDLNDFRDEEKLKIYQSKINDLKEQINVNMELVYENLQEAQKVLRIFSFQGPSINKSQVQDIVEKIVKSLFTLKQGTMRHRFAECMTGRGKINYYNNLLENIKYKYFLNGIGYINAGSILNFIARVAVKCGLIVDVYHNYLDPEIIELLILPEMSLGIGAKAFLEGFQEIMIFENIQNSKFITESQTDNTFKAYLTEGIQRLAEVQELSEQLGDLYQAVFDFNQIENLEKELLVKILNITIKEEG